MKKAIRTWDYRQEYASIRDEILEAIDQVFQSGQLILGPNVVAFESAFADYCGRTYGVGVNSGTDALFLALKALDIKEGDEVLTVTNTAVPTVSAIVSAGGIPRFVDVDLQTGLMDVEALLPALTPRTRFIVPVHLYGQCVDMNPLLDFAKSNGLKVVEDCAQATGSTYKSRKAGMMGDAAAFSFYPTKNLGAYGDGGMIVTDDLKIAERARKLRMYGMANEYRSLEHGINSRLDEVHAAILLIKLKYLDQWIEKRRQLAALYDNLLSGSGLALPVESSGNSHTYHLYVVRHQQRDAVVSALKELGLSIGINYPHPIHMMPAYKNLGYVEGDLPVSEQLAKEIFSVPLYPTMPDQDVHSISDMLVEILRTI
jgi:dTDP-3-amino-2,3,6-trideoxy-4-keto-D-glucose/dTDP-3-amino-3,4,6-trideoxy-alpha-D-glucose/dTDP-2,6-dideoxy-D-kanosamine transaminase